MKEKDLQHLRWLSVAYYGLGGLFAFLAVFSIVFLVFGVLFLTTDVLRKAGNPEHAGLLFGSLNLLVSVMFFLTGAILGFGCFLSARRLKEQKNYSFCLIFAVLVCLFSPLGTILGILTIIVLMRDSVKRLF